MNALLERTRLRWISWRWHNEREVSVTIEGRDGLIVSLVLLREDAQHLVARLTEALERGEGRSLQT